MDPEEIGYIDVEDSGAEQGHVNEYVSVSRLKLYQTCPQQFRFRYVDRLPRDDSSEPAEFGKLVHAALEDLFRWVQFEEYSGVLPEDRLIEYFRVRWQEGGIDSPKLYEEGIELCRGYLQQYPDIDHFDVLAVEHEFRIQIGPFLFFGFLDRVDRIDNDEIVVIDYKTNRLLFEREELATDLQASIYINVAKQIWPWAKKVRFRFDMLRHGLSQHTERTEEALQSALMYAVDTAKKTERTDQKWPARINTLCAWCDYRKRCDAYQGALKDGMELAMVDVKDLAALSKQREALAQMIKPLESRRKEIDGILKKRLEDQPNGEMRLGNYNYRVINVFKKTYPVDDTLELLKRYGATDEEIEKAGIIETNKKAVESMAKTLAERLDAENKSKRTMFQMELKAITNIEFAFGRFDSRALNKELVSEPEMKRLAANEPPAPTEYSEERKCGFCEKSPAKEVERSGAAFNVCKEHSRKRKPPAQLESKG